MQWQGTPLIIPLIMVIAIGVVLTAYVWRHRRTPAARTIVLILLAGCGYLLSYMLQLSSIDLLAKIIWHKLMTSFAIVVYMTFLVFTLQHTGREKSVTRHNLMLLSIIPVITLLLIFTNERHGLIWSSFELIIDGFRLLRYSYGAWFWVHVVYSQILILFCNFLLICMLIRARHFYRLRITSLLATSVSLEILGVLSFSGMPPLLFLFIAALLIPAAGVILTLSIFRFRVADIVPVARGAVIDGMNDGVIVLDPQNHIMDVNPLVQQLTGCPISELIGKPVEEVWPEWSDQIEPSSNEIKAGKEIVTNLEDEQRIYDVGISSLTDLRGDPVSQIVVLRDITERKQAEEKLLQSRLQLKNLFEASKLINSTMNMEEMYKFVSDSVQKLVGFDYFIIFLVSEDKKRIYPSYASEGIKEKQNLVFDYGEGWVGQCIETAEILLDNTHKEKEVFDLLDTESQIIVPLIVEDQCVGALHISKCIPHAYTQDDADALSLLSEVISSAMRKSWLHNEIKQFSSNLERRVKEKSHRTEIILNTRQNLQTETNWEKGLTKIVESMSKLGFEQVGVFLVNPVKETLEFHLGKGVDLPKVGTSVLLKNLEYFGVQCVLRKETIHVEDSSLVKGKQIVDSTSFVWVPIIVQDEAFAALAASNVKSKKIVTDEDVKDLEILAGMCAAFIDRTRTVIEPVAENSLKTEIKHSLNPMEGYIILEKKPEKSFEIFVDLVTHGISGFVVSREYPEKLREKYRLVKTPTLWLSKTEMKNAINPDDLSKLYYIIGEFTKESEESVILLDGLEYLIIYNDFNTVLKCLQELKDTIILHKSRLIIPAHKDILSPRELSMLEREFTVLKPG